MRFSNLGLKAKIITGSCLPLLLVVGLGIVTTMSVKSLLRDSDMVDHTHVVVEEAMSMVASAVDMETGMRGYLLAGKEGFLDPYIGGQKHFFELVKDLKKTVDDNPAQVQLLEEVEENITLWVQDVTEPAIQLRRNIGDAKTMNDMAKVVGEARGKKYFDEFRGQIATFISREETLMGQRKKASKGSTNIQELRQAALWVEHTHEVIADANNILAAAVDMETGMRGYLLAGIESFLEPYEAGKSSFSRRVKELKKTVDDNPAQLQLLAEIEKNISAWQKNVTEPAIALRHEIGDAKTMDDMVDLVAEARGKKYFDKFRNQMEIFEGREISLKAQRQQAAHNTAGKTIKTIFLGTLATLVMAVLISYFLGRAIVTPVNRMIDGLTEGTDQVVLASTQVASSSQSLAGGASQQAASLEQTSSSLEEMASMTKLNASNAHQADSLMKEANQVVSQANDSMGQLTTSMEEISKASQDTSKIIKTIDEIAFQTNLLALNAAVEAARAGEAGAGFAVVADEVRNLAMRAAEAAKNTADLIEGTVKKVQDGSQLVTTTNDAFTQVATGTSKVGELVVEISASSNEQANGIDEVNRAMAEMDKVTQDNASNSEESASASEEMNAQAAHMKGIVEELAGLVGGQRHRVGGGRGANYREVSHQNSAPAGSGRVKRPALAASVRTADDTHPKMDNTSNVNPDEIIPMDEEEFNDF